MSIHQPTRILLVGGGGREHALAWKLAAEPGVNEVIVLPGSDGVAEVPRVRVAGGRVDPGAVVDLCRSRAVELVVIGPEQPLADGLVDELQDAGVLAFGPTAAAARIETSKAFCHEIAAAAGVRMARSRTCGSAVETIDAIVELAGEGRGFVVKQDGLAAGKGVTVYEAADTERARRDVEALFGDNPAATVVVEERLDGREASVIAITDGRDLLALPAARDHKRLRDGDEGPNTGGMGAYNPLPDLPDEAVVEVVASFHRPVVAELARRGSPFVGALYAGLMLTADGPVLLEFNARFGDPETQVILPRLATALGPVLRAAARDELARAVSSLHLREPILPTAGLATVGIVLAAAGYPGTRSAGEPIEGIEAASADGGLVFHGGTRRGPHGGWTTEGGRILTVVGRGRDLVEARAAAEQAADRISWPGMQRRRDIAAHLPVPEAVA
ncbi:MAG TPA: phosphoribosylamine--glycine ligase [Candidatus Limnocylindrales bacterium]|nr:phosphoribosylamine--glycine ligase [Candidatus Limnocylindrales bacterium]